VARIPSAIAIMTATAVVSVLNACLSAGFAAEQTVGLRAVDDQKAVTMIHPAPQIFISQAKTMGEFQ